ncbi:MAG: hypothetical protein Q3976_07725 [Corynebacterium sp.]|nr:hypothetical protein [Corynebacterium sp.]
MGEIIQRTPGSAIFVREKQTLQFGLDARISGVFQCEMSDPEAIVQVLNAGRVATTGLYADLRAIGLPAATAYGLIEDLLTHGIFEYCSTHPIQIIGRGEIFERINELCTHPANLSFEITHAGEDESIMQYLVRGRHDVPLVLAVDNGMRRDYAAGLRGYETVIPVTHIDGQGIIGPLRLRHAGPCVLCSYFHRCQRDPLWREVLQAAPFPGEIDPASAYATAAYAFAIIQGLYQHHVGPGIHLENPRPGQVIRVTSQRNHTKIMQTHPLCPECHGYS